MSPRLLRAAAATAACALAALATPSAAAAQSLTFDAASSFPAFNTPGGPFQAGHTTEYLGALTPYTNRGVMTSGGGRTLQTLNAGPLVPGAFLAGPTGYDDANFTPTFGPNVLGLHPGAQGEFSTVRFTAPVAAVYTFSFTVYGLDASGPNDGTTSDANLAVPDEDYGYLLYGGSVNGHGLGDEGTDTETIGNVLLDAGQFVDFSVGYGDNEDYAYDMTALDLRVTADAGAPAVTTPEPATLALVGAGVLALGAARRRRSAPALGLTGWSVAGAWQERRSLRRDDVD